MVVYTFTRIYVMLQVTTIVVGLHENFSKCYTEK